MSRFLEIFLPHEARPLFVLIYLFFACILLMTGVHEFLLSTFYRSVFLFSWLLVVISVLILCYLKWQRFVELQSNVLKAAHGAVVVGLIVVVAGSFFRERPFSRLLVSLLFFVLILLIFSGTTGLVYFFIKRSERKVQALLRDRKALGKRIFGIGAIAGLMYMNPRRRGIYFVALIALGLLVGYASLVLIQHELVLTGLLLFFGAAVADMLIESVVYAEIAEKRSVEGELEAARQIQLGLMPKEDPQVPGFDISGVCQPANEVGGDFFDYLWLDAKKTKLAIVVADVSGKAMKAAITAVMTSGMIYREVGGNESPRAILRKINRPMYTKLDSRMFTALSLAAIDVKKKELKFSNAGQSYPVLKRGKEVIPLEVKGARLPLGVKEDVTYGEMAVKLKKGDTIIFFTDGIPETKNDKDEFYGFERFKAFLQRLDPLPSKEMKDQILSEVASFAGNAPQHDDMTVVVVHVTS